MSIQTEQHTLAENIDLSRAKSNDASILRKLLFRKLEKLEVGNLIIKDSGNTWYFGDTQSTLQSVLYVHDKRFYSSIIFGGNVGAGEAYMAGYWESNDLVSLFRILLQNRHVLSGLNTGSAWVKRISDLIYHKLHANTVSGSRKNIEAHYDLSNDFYKLFLDPTMTYSAGVFKSDDSTMEEATLEKYERLCQMLNLSEKDHVLEIGTGWGGFARYAAEKYGCEITTTTISQEQYTYAAIAISEAGLSDRVEILSLDYRELPTLNKKFDKIVSIEMIEAVGYEYIPQFFAICETMLKPDGEMAFQGITFADKHYSSYRNNADFIRRYIFPGGTLISVNHVMETLAAKSSFQVQKLEEIGIHYARTLLEWRKSFEANLDNVRELGFEERFIRMWRYYLTYCEAGFREHHIGNVQVHLKKV
ncbi:cyclopropane-fatty-acyl-phospholipid synthase family protein [bacterium]|nr:cyclopropane-fatty-acyl-phospholipid synthase family protein [bacterium]